MKITIAHLQANRAIFHDDRIEEYNIPPKGISISDMLNLTMPLDLRMRILIYSLPRPVVHNWLAGVVQRLATRLHQPTHLLGAFAELLTEPKDTRLFGRAVRQVAHAAIEAAGSDAWHEVERQCGVDVLAPNMPAFIEAGKAAETVRETERRQQLLDLCRQVAKEGCDVL